MGAGLAQKRLRPLFCGGLDSKVTPCLLHTGWGCSQVTPALLRGYSSVRNGGFQPYPGLLRGYSEFTQGLLQGYSWFSGVTPGLLCGYTGYSRVTLWILQGYSRVALDTP